MHRLGRERFDAGSVQPERLMYMPTFPADRGDYEHHVLDGAPLPVEAVLLDEQMDPTVPPEPEPVEAAAGDGPAYEDLSAVEQRNADAQVQRRVDGWRKQLAEAEDWPEGHRDDRDRGWERLLADAADTLAALAHSPWNALTLAEAEALYDGIVPEAMAEAVPGKWAAKATSDHARAGLPWEPPGAEFEPLPPEDDQQEAAPDRTRWADGGAFLFDQPDDVPLIWGTETAALWAEGESLMLVGPPGVGKTTVTGQLVHALLFGGEVLGWPVVPAAGRVLYLAMDRPRQIARALRRHFTPEQRAVISERLMVWQGPPPEDMAKDTELLARLAAKAGASHVVVDSLKDAALGLTEEAGAGGYNRARQTALAAGVQVLELHHMVKRGANGKAPTTLADLYGGMPITAGAGSVLLLWADVGGARRVTVRHLKPILEPVPQAEVEHDHAAGVSWRTGHATPAQTAIAWMDQERISIEDGERRVLDRVKAAGHTWSREAVRQAMRERRERHQQVASEFGSEEEEVPQ
ncbi:AAA family ATPase, partial [Ruania rhizosphaerae]|uniref:AAA family ATPase n=1 Tax=Ruania rhizosphaerae TaxID=1840413 RepID=UPI0013576925